MNNTREIIVSVFSVAVKIIIVIIAAMLIFKYAMTAYDYGYRIFSEEPMGSGEGRVVSVTITSDMKVKDIGELLENKGLIRDSVLFRLQERLSENHGKIVPGTYELNTNMTAEQMITIMAGSSDIIEEEEPVIATDEEAAEEIPFEEGVEFSEPIGGEVIEEVTQ